MTMNRPRKWRVASSQDDVPPGICKCGRLTEREAWLPKIERFADAGAELLEPVESTSDQNEADAVLFFDEADSLLFKRVSTGESCSTTINRNRNALMQKLDRFGGVVGWRAAVRASRGAGHAEKRRIRFIRANARARGRHTAASLSPAAALEIPRCHAVDLLEDAGKVVGIFEADGPAGGFDRKVRLLQQPRGVLHAQTGEELRGGLPGVFAEESGKIFRSDPARTGRITRTAQGGVICHEVFAAAVENAAASRGQAGLCLRFRPDSEQKGFEERCGDFALLPGRQFRAREKLLVELRNIARAGRMTDALLVKPRTSQFLCRRRATEVGEILAVRSVANCAHASRARRTVDQHRAGGGRNPTSAPQHLPSPALQQLDGVPAEGGPVDGELPLALLVSRADQSERTTGRGVHENVASMPDVRRDKAGRRGLAGRHKGQIYPSSDQADPW